MNEHLLPFPYNQAQPPTWLERVTRPLSDFLFGGATRKESTPEKPSTSPITLQGNGDDLPPIRIICISDTHNKIPPLPPGDILVHAGDLTTHGTFDEVQAQLRWLSSQPHTHKIVIAGNHDIVLDEASDTRFLTRREDSATKRKELDWSGIKVLARHSSHVGAGGRRSRKPASAQSQDIRVSTDAGARLLGFSVSSNPRRVDRAGPR